jgi:hypothetical protein
MHEEKIACLVVTDSLRPPRVHGRPPAERGDPTIRRLPQPRIHNSSQHDRSAIKAVAPSYLGLRLIKLIINLVLFSIFPIIIWGKSEEAK